MLDQYGEAQTRRVEAALKEINRTPNIWQCEMLPSGVIACRQKISYTGGCYSSDWVHPKPRYHVSETVYIKEAYKVIGTVALRQGDKTVKEAGVDYKDGSRIDKVCPLHILADQQWHSPMMMPEWAARHFIKIIGVREERLGAITEDDAEAEGVNQEYIFKHGLYIEDGKTYRRGYRHLWNSINPKYPWESNPWVFAYTFQQGSKHEAS